MKQLKIRLQIKIETNIYTKLKINALYVKRTNTLVDNLKKTNKNNFKHAITQIIETFSVAICCVNKLRR